MAAITRPALRYYGGKWRLAPWIISHFPPHHHYVEPFGGAGSVLLRKSRSKLETYNDIDGRIVNYFRVLRERPDDLVRLINLTPWARAEYELCAEPSAEPLEDARRLFMTHEMRIAAHAKTRGFRTNLHNREFNCPAQQHARRKDYLHLVRHRLMGVQIENSDALYVIERYDTTETLFYVDPPYVEETRTHTDAYDHEAPDIHEPLAAALSAIDGMAIVSGYRCDLYDELYSDWRRVDKVAKTNGAARTESLWISPRADEMRTRQLRLL